MHRSRAGGCAGSPVLPPIARTVAIAPMSISTLLAAVESPAGGGEGDVREEMEPLRRRTEPEVERRRARDGVDRAQNGGPTGEHCVVRDHRQGEPVIAPRRRDLPRDEE